MGKRDSAVEIIRNCLVALSEEYENDVELLNKFLSIREEAYGDLSLGPVGVRYSMTKINQLKAKYGNEGIHSSDVAGTILFTHYLSEKLGEIRCFVKGLEEKEVDLDSFVNSFSEFIPSLTKSQNDFVSGVMSEAFRRDKKLDEVVPVERIMADYRLV